MSSVIVHLCIAVKVAEKLNFSYEYILGSILPDLTKKLPGKTREITHYITEIKDGVLDLPNLEKYLSENNLNSEKELGIYSHLIEDKVYFKNYVGKYIEILDNDMNKIKFNLDGKVRNYKEYQRILYNDFSLLNFYLIKKYNLDMTKIKNQLIKLVDNQIIKKQIEEYIKEYEFIQGKLILFNQDEAEKCINESIKEVIYNINNYRK